jgi:hypothetical protein
MGVGKGAIKGGAFVAGHAIHGGGAVVGGVGHGIGTVGGFAGRKIGLIKKKDKSGKEVLVQADADPNDPSAIAQAQALGGDGQEGTLGITVISGSGLVSKEGSGVKPYVVVKNGGKSHKTGHGKGIEPEWYVILSSRSVMELMGRNETLTFTVGPETPSFNVSVLGTSSIPREIEIC